MCKEIIIRAHASNVIHLMYYLILSVFMGLFLIRLARELLLLLSRIALGTKRVSNRSIIVDPAISKIIGYCFDHILSIILIHFSFALKEFELFTNCSHVGTALHSR